LSLTIKPSAQHPTAQHVAVDLLARREHSAHELKRKLVQRGYDKAVVDDTMAALAAKDMQSDARFAEQFVRARVTKGCGPLRVQAELAQRGCSNAHAWLAEYDWDERCAQVRTKKFGERLPCLAAERARQARFLQYRGFTSDQIQRALRRR
jgi:regulatory protein